MNKHKLSLALVSITLLATPVFTFAFATREGERMSETRYASRSAQRSQLRCETMNNLISAHSKNMEARKDLHVEVYTEARTRISKLATRLKSEGYDTSKLEADLATLDNMIAKLSSDYQTLKSQVSVTTNIDCETSSDDFKTQLNGVRTQLATLRTQAKEIHNFMRDTIKADLKALRQQRPTPTVTIESESK